MNKELKISAENALAAYNNTDANGRELLEHLFGKELFAPKDIKERVKTFDDACKELGECHHTVKAYRALMDECVYDDAKDIIAYLKLRIIAAALNEGWVPQFTEDECRYYPWFYIYSKSEYDELDEDEKKDCRVVGRSHHSAHAGGGVAFANANVASSFSLTGVGSRLAFKTRELAEYCGKQFIEIWEKWLFA